MCNASCFVLDVQKNASLLAAFTTQSRSELSLMVKIQVGEHLSVVAGLPGQALELTTFP